MHVRHLAGLLAGLCWAVSLVAQTGPTIDIQPADVAATAGQPATLSVSVTGSGILSYQWRRNGFPIAGATNSTYTIISASRTDADYYDVVVGDGLSTTVSSAARLDVAPSAYPNLVTVDPNWNVVLETKNAAVNKVLPLASGQFLVAGDFARINGHATGDVARFNADGTIDSTFVAPVLNGYVKTLAVQSDGKILAGGGFTLQVGVITYRYLIRLNADGSLDTTFNTDGAGPSGVVYALAMAADGKIYVGGGFNSYNGISRNHLARLNADGTLDTTYAPVANDSVQSLVVQDDGKVVAGGLFSMIAGASRSRIARLNTDGTIDLSFDPGTGPNSNVLALALAGDGKIYAGGSFNTYDGASVAHYLRLNADGTLDTNFDTSGYSGSQVESLFVQADGQLLIGGGFWRIRGQSRWHLARVGAEGTLESVPAIRFGSSVLSAAASGDGRILACGWFTTVGSSGREGLARLSSDGTLDAGFAPTVLQQGKVHSIAPVPGGRLAIAGDFHFVNGTPRNHVAQINADGSLDISFDPGAGADSSTRHIVRQADGKLIVAGYFSSFNGSGRPGMVRLLANGSVDPEFAPTELPMGLATVVAAPGGKVVIGGGFSESSFGAAGSRSYLARLNGNGSLDEGFAPGLSSDVYCAAAQADGKLLIGGSFTAVNGVARSRIARLNADGTLDTTFDPGAGANGDVIQLAGLPGSDAWVFGDFSSYNATARTQLARLLSSGGLDTAFANAPFTGWINWPRIGAILPQGDGRVIVAGNFSALSGAAASQNLVRLNADGTVDTTFGAAGLPSAIQALAQGDDGELYLAAGNRFVRTMVGSAPAISAQPASAMTAVGGSFTFSVTASSSPAPSYQWYFNGMLIPGATGASYTVDNAQLAHVGRYSVLVGNAFGSVTSIAVTLSGTAPGPTITVQPADVAATAGQPATLSVTANGTSALMYQWRRNGFPVSGATGAIYTIPSVSRTDADYYDVVIADGLSTTVSNAARLDVAPSTYPNLVTVDPHWSVVLETKNAAINQVLPLASGQFLVAGDFVRINGHATGDVARFNADGTIDPTFVAPVLEGYAKTIAVQAGGRILVGGDFTLQVGAITYHHLIRLNTDGTLDTTFNPGGAGPNFGVRALALAPDGKIYAGGWFFSYNNIPRSNLVRLNADGTLDAGYLATASNSVNALVVQADETLVVGGLFTTIAGANRNGIARLDTDGTVDASFNPGTGLNSGGTVLALALAGDGKIYLGGGLGTYNGASVASYLRLNADGTLDTSFDTSGYSGSQVESLFVQTDGKLLIGGNFTRIRGQSRWHLARVGADGALEATPVASFDRNVSTAVVSGDGSILVGGQLTMVDSSHRELLARLSGDGILDAEFAPTILQQGNVRSIAPVPGGKLAIAGDFNFVNGTARNHVAQLNADGSLDATFDPGAGASSNTTHIVRQADGKFIIAGYFSYFGGEYRAGLVRLLADGAVDTEFAPISSPTGLNTVIAAPGGKVVVGGWFSGSSFGTSDSPSHLARLLADGGLDTTFDPSLDNTVMSAVAQPDGKLLVGGSFTAIDGAARNRVARLNADGTVDLTFDPGAGASSVSCVVSLPGNAAWMGGSFSSYDGTSRNLLTRVLSTGAVDTSFARAPFNGWSSLPSIASILPQNDGKVIVAGGINALSGAPATRYLARLNADGTVDTTFGAIGLPDAIYALAQADDGQFHLATGKSLVRTKSEPGPVIVNQPSAAADLAEGNGSYMMSVTAVAGSDLTYQWLHNGTLISGATARSYTISPVTPASAGSYSVVVSAGGLSTSSTPLTITTHAVAPASPSVIGTSARAVPTGTNMLLEACVGAGTPPLSYQWRFNGEPILDATGSGYFIRNGQPAASGRYSVMVSNSLGSATSEDYTLFIQPEGGWTHLNPRPTSNALGRIAYLNGHFLIGGLRTTLLTSTDGLSWKTRTVPAANNLLGFAYGKNLYVALGSHGALFTSSDLEVWTPRDSGVGADGSSIHDVAFGNDRFVGAGLGGTIITSDDGVTWMTGTLGTEDTINNLVLADGKFYGIAYVPGTDTEPASCRVYSSPDGAAWSSVSVEAPLVGIGYGAGMFVAVGDGGTIFASADGVSWTASESGTNEDLWVVRYLDSVFVATGANGTLLSSPDGTTWTARDTGLSDGLQDVAFGSSRVVAVAGGTGSRGGLISSPDAVTWTQQIAGPAADERLYAIATGDGTIVAVGSGGTIVRSTDAREWLEVDATTSAQLNDVAFGADLFVAVGYEGTLATSADGSAWTFRTSPAGAANYRAVNFGNSQFVAVGDSGVIATSPDGAVWTSRISGTTSSLYGTAFGAGVHVAVGANGTFLTSPDGTAWTVRGYSFIDASLRDVVYADGQFVVVGDGVILTSPDGIAWTDHDVPRDPFNAVIYANGHFYATVTSRSYYYVSADGANWTARFNGVDDAILDLVYVGGQLIGVGDGTAIISAGVPIVGKPTDHSVQEGAPVALFAPVAASPDAPSRQWQKDGVSIPGATEPRLSFSNVTPDDAGSYRLVVTNSFGSTVSAAATLTVDAIAVAPAISTHPASQTVIAEADVTFSVVASGTAPLSYQWKKGAKVIDGQTGASLTLSAVQATDAGNYTVVVTNAAGTVTSSVATLTVNPAPVAPTISSQPEDQEAAEGAQATFTVSAAGSEPLSYQWHKDGVVLPDATSASLVIQQAQPDDAGSYTVVVTNAAGSMISTAASLAVITPPSITTQPEDRSMTAGANVSFSVIAAGTAPLGYQWSRDGSTIASATAATLTLEDVQATDAGNYTVVVTNAAGAATSAVATLTVNPAPVAPSIAVALASQTVTAGASVTFTVSASGTNPLIYTWRKDGVAIAGQTASSLTLTNVQLADAGGYSVRVANVAGAVVSEAATLTVNLRSFAGYYSGSFGSDTGFWVMYIRPDNTGVYLAHLPQRRSIIAINLVVKQDGTFTVTSTEIRSANSARELAMTASRASGSTGGLTAKTTGAPAAASALADEITLSGGITDTGLTGELIGLGESFKGQELPSTGAAADRAGLYTASALDGSSGSTYAIVVPSGETFVVADVGGVIDGGVGLVDAQGEVSITTADGTQLELTVDPATAFTAEVMPSGASTPVTFGGLPDGVESTSRLINLSIRGMAGTGHQTLIVGYITKGAGSKKVLIRALGPTLFDYGVTDFLANPRLARFDASGSATDLNDDWGGGEALKAIFERVGAPELEDASRDAALFLELPPGISTAHVGSDDGSTGVALAEVFDSDAGEPTTRFVNFSARNQVGVGDSILIAGFILGGNAPKTLLIRGVGPTLVEQGVSGVLANPQLTLFRGSTAIASNDDWGGTAALAAAFTQTGAFDLPVTSRDAALLVTVPPGIYTVHVRGVDDTTGIALVEIYEMP